MSVTVPDTKKVPINANLKKRAWTMKLWLCYLFPPNLSQIKIQLRKGFPF